MQIKTDFTTIQNARLYYETVGEGKPLLLLHSGIADHRMWVEQQRELSKSFQVITPDFQSYGKSSTPNALFRHYEDIHGLISHLNFKSINVIGCSIGGKVAIELAIAYPELIDHLILVAPGLPGYEYQDKETLEKDMVLENLASKRKYEAVADLLVDIWVVGLRREKRKIGSDLIALVREMILDNYDSVIDKYPEKEPEFNLISRLGEIRSPASVMIGDSDLPDMLTISQIVTAKIPNARRYLIPDAAHFPNLERSSIFNQIVLDCLNAS